MIRKTAAYHGCSVNFWCVARDYRVGELENQGGRVLIDRQTQTSWTTITDCVGDRSNASALIALTNRLLVCTAISGGNLTVGQRREL